MNLRSMLVLREGLVDLCNYVTDVFVASWHESAQSNVGVTHLDVLMNLTGVRGSIKALDNSNRCELAALRFPRLKKDSSILFRQLDSSLPFVLRQLGSIPFVIDNFSQRNVVYACAQVEFIQLIDSDGLIY